MATKAILSISLFILLYFLLILLSIGLIILCGYIGIGLVIVKPMAITILLGAGLVSMGILIFIFLIKFLFSRHTTNQSQLLEITREQEPVLFSFIQEIATETKTDFPKKIFISSEVNASVFYDSSFWSMFLPVKKNLLIGMGLVNSVTVLELKAILAHEFGHFSQRTMKVGSYVYNVNKVIHNMLYENESYESLAQKWSNASSYFALFVGIAAKIVQGIQWLLRQSYQLVNLNHMALSREMEFHADEVAANVAGSGPLVSSLLRSGLADRSFDLVLDYYNDRIPESVKTLDIYPQQTFVMNFIAEESQVPIQDNLPLVSIEHLSRYNKSRLSIKDQWASHPSTEERIQRLHALNLEAEQEDGKPASSLFRDAHQLQVQITERLFAGVQYETTPSLKSLHHFTEDYISEYKKRSFDKLFNSYYDNKTPALPKMDDVVSGSPSASKLQLESLFSDTKVDLVYTCLALENDITTLEQIAEGNYSVPTFDYNGIKYDAKDCPELIKTLKVELAGIREQIQENDLAIYRYFLNLASSQQKEKVFLSHFRTFTQFDKKYDRMFEIVVRVVNESNFVHTTTPFGVIEKNLETLSATEKELKEQIRYMLSNELFQPELTTEIRETFESYISKEWVYFVETEYDATALNGLFESIQYYQQTLSGTYFRLKKELLEFEAALERSSTLNMATRPC